LALAMFDAFFVRVFRLSRFACPDFVRPPFERKLPQLSISHPARGFTACEKPVGRRGRLPCMRTTATSPQAAFSSGTNA
jgi:hypothetical protein